MKTSWASYRLPRAASTKRIYDEIIVNGMCGHFDILAGSGQHSDYYVVGQVLWL